MKTLWINNHDLELNPPSWENALDYLDTFTCLDSEFGVVDLVTTGMFDLSHPDTAAELDVSKALRTIRQKASIAKEVMRWISENKEILGAYPDAERNVGLT